MINYRLKDDRSQRAITGLSMGGGQALTIGLQNLDQFAWIGGFSSAAPCDNLEATFPEFVSNPSAVNARVELCSGSPAAKRISCSDATRRLLPGCSPEELRTSLC